MAPVQVLSIDVGIRNFAFCILRMDLEAPDATVPRVEALEVVDLGCRKGQTAAILDAVLDVLDDLTFSRLDTQLPLVVLIEAQMTSVMKAIQTAIHVYYKVTAKYTDLDITAQVLSARHKLALMERYPDYAPPAPSQRTQYKQNKVDSVALAAWLLEHKLKDAATLAKLRSLKKADDCADSFCAAMYYVHASKRT